MKKRIFLFCLAGVFARSHAMELNAAQAEEMARIYQSGDYAALHALITPWAEAGEKYSQNNLDVLYRDGLGVKKDSDQALHWFAKAAAQGYDEAQVNLAVLSGGHVRALREAAESGNAQAQFNLGLRHEQGTNGVTQDADEAVRWYEKAAAQGHRDAIHNLAVMYFRGKGVAQDDRKAFYWFARNAEAGDGEAQFNLGVMYGAGRGTGKDVERARQWYEKAAAQGSVDAMENLGRLHYFERHDMEGARQWWQKAADAGRPGAQFNLGVLYANGQGVAKDADAARQWWEKAAAQGHEEAKKSLREGKGGL